MIAADQSMPEEKATAIINAILASSPKLYTRIKKSPIIPVYGAKLLQQPQ
jgi:hypothetical protein